MTVTASVGGFVPKAHTPFQWFGQNTMEELRRKVGLLKDAARGTRGLTLRWHDPEATAVEGLVSRGDRRMGAVIEHVWRHGGTFQEWSEHFDLGLWTNALEAAGLDFAETVYRHRDEHEVLPWDHVSAGLHRDFLWQDFQEALAEHGLEDCRWTPCYDCGACTGLGVEHMVASPVPPAGGSQGTGQDLASGGTVPVRFLETAGAGRVRRLDAGRGPMKIRVRFTKVGRVRWTSHRDVARMWERALRRARMPVAYTAGFTPRPQLSFGLALPTGCESVAEYLDIALDETFDPAELAPDSQPDVARGRRRGGRRPSSSRARTRSRRTCPRVTWEIPVPGVGSVELEAAIERALVAESLPIRRERKGRDVVDDLRPSVLALSCAGYDADGAQLVAELGTRPRGVRPSELAQALGIELGLARRTCQWIERDGSRWEPLRVDPAGTAVMLGARLVRSTRRDRPHVRYEHRAADGGADRLPVCPPVHRPRGGERRPGVNSGHREVSPRTEPARHAEPARRA